MGEALRVVIASGGDPFAQSRTQLVAAIESMLVAGQAEGTLRSGVDPVDVIMAVNGIASGITSGTGGGSPEQRAQVGRLFDLVVDGLRYRADQR